MQQVSLDQIHIAGGGNSLFAYASRFWLLLHAMRRLHIRRIKLGHLWILCMCKDLVTSSAE